MFTKQMNFRANKFPTWNIKNGHSKSLYSLPWDQSTLIGYFGEISFNVIVGVTYFISNGVMMLLYISICIHHQTFYEMMEHSINKWTSSDKNERNTEKFLRNLICFHISAKELSTITACNFSIQNSVNYIVSFFQHQFLDYS